MKESEMFPSKYLTKDDVGEEGVVATVMALKKVNVARDDQAPEYKWEIKFGELDKPLLANKTNAKRMFKFLGDDTELWLGKQVILYDDPNVEYKGEVTGGIRVRKVAATTKKPLSEEERANTMLRDIDDERPPF